MRLIKYALIATAIMLIGYARIKGIDLTEGQLLIEYWLHFLLAVVLLFSAVFLVRYEAYRELKEKRMNSNKDVVKNKKEQP